MPTQRDELGYSLRRIVAELIDARGYAGVWDQLWPTNDQIARVENRYRSFFGFTRKALKQQLFLSLAKVVEKRKREENLSIWRLLAIIEKDPTLLQGPLDVDDLRETLANRQDLLRRIMDYRDKELAHIDEKYLLGVGLNQQEDERVKILLGEIMTIQTDLEEEVNKICVAYNGSHQQFETLGHTDTTWLLNDAVKWVYKE